MNQIKNSYQSFFPCFFMNPCLFQENKLKKIITKSEIKKFCHRSKFETWSWTVFSSTSLKDLQCCIKMHERLKKESKKKAKNYWMNKIYKIARIPVPCKSPRCLNKRNGHHISKNWFNCDKLLEDRVRDLNKKKKLRIYVWMINYKREFWCHSFLSLCRR